MIGSTIETCTQTTPRVSIGLPVFNGEKFLEQSITSILAQTFADFEFIISDNGSVDRTETICRSYAARDPRIRYLRQERNRGAAWNHNFVFECSRGEYFKWQCHDDLCEPTFVEKCVAVLDREPAIVLCYSQFARIDENSELVPATSAGWAPIASSSVSGIESPHERFQALIHRRDACEEIYGLMRARAARETRLVGAYAQSDDNFLAELALRGGFYEIPEPLFRYRLHPENSTKTHSTRLERLLWFDPNGRRRFYIPFLRQFREYLLLIRRAPVSRRERIHCYLHTLGWAWRFRAWLAEDLHEGIFLGLLVPFLKKHAIWTRAAWRTLKRLMHSRRVVS
ncbi:MAG: glycosyltransferase family 2 protein [Acidobacteria bacterium]|nr:glycosyltransferase family 2 protein [Acidobacteriota bacterium]